MKKKGIKYILSLLALSCSIVYLLLRIFGIIDNRLHLNSRYHAYASQSWDTRVLTPQETIGLYGTRIQVTYSGIDQIDQIFQLQLIGTWDTPHYWPTVSWDERLFPPGHWANDNFNPLWFSPSLNQQYITAYSNDLKRAPFLIYGCYFGGFFHSHSSIAHPNIAVNPNFLIPIDVINYEQCILFQRSADARDSGWSLVRHVTSGQTFSSSQMVNAIDGSGKGQSVITPYPSYIDSEDGLQFGMIDFHIGSLLSDTTWNYSGQQWVFNGCDVYNSLSEGQWFFVYVQCPEITTNYNPPLPQTTEPPPETTRADFTTYNFTYDLSPLETNQQNQIRLQNQQVEIELAQLNGINYICRRLDDIYNQMVRNGEISVNLIPADKVQLYNSDVRDSINGILTSYTTSQLPNYEYQMDFVHRAFLFLWAEPWIAALGGLSLCASVAAWIIFEGRRG